MADNTANIKVNVTSNGSKELRADAEATASAYKRAEDSLKKISATSKRVATPVAAAKMAAEKEELTSYGVSRSAVGTGAAGRDFAQQAQASSGGLGGLVRLYATFAANIFAATAAFSALSKAADTTNMIRGLDQLGASSGRNLGTLAKNLTSVSDGAISLRDSMEAVAKTSSAGLTNQQIMRLGAVAKNASQALGVGMPDAISRLSRGISKIEPELLDELGIFVRVDKAVQDYARSLGKATSSLSDFERRQAYAQAVLKEGEEKFAAVNLEANPYSKLLASLANTAQQVLEIINKGLGPIANLLAENSGILVTALTVLVGTLLNKALPAIGQWREGVKQAALDSRKAANEIVESYGARFVERTQASFKVPELGRKLTEAKVEFAKSGQEVGKALAEGIASGAIKKGSLAYEEISKGNTELSDKAISNLRRSSNAIKDLSNEENVLRKAQIDGILKVSATHKSAYAAMTETEKAYNTAANASLNAASKEVRKYSEEWQRIQIAKRATAKAERLNIVSDVNTATQEGGMAEGFKLLKERVTDNKLLEGFAKIRTYGAGAFTILASAINTAALAFQKFFFYIGIAIAVFNILKSIFSNTAKQAEATSKAIEDLDSATENLSKTIDLINKKSFLEQLSPSSMASKFTAIEGLSTAIISAFEKAQEEINAMSWFDEWIDTFKKLWGGDVSSKLADSIGGAMAKSFKALKGSPAERQIKEELKSLLNITSEDKDTISEKFKSSSLETQKQVVQGYEKLKTVVTEASGELKQLEESQKALNKSSQDFMNLFVPKDPQSLVGMGMMKVVTDLNKLLSDPLTEVSAIVAGFKDLNLFPAETAESFIKLSESVNQNAEDFGRAQARIEEYSIEIAKLDKQIAQASKNKDNRSLGVAGISGAAFATGASIQASRGAMSEENVKTLEVQKEILENARTEAEKYGSNLNKELQKAKLELGQGLTLAFNKGLDLVTAKFASEAAKGASIYTNAIAGVMGDTKAAAMLRLASDKAAIAAQQRAIDVQLDLIKQTQNLAIKTELSTAALDKSNYLKQKENIFVESDREAIQAKIDNIDKNIVPQLQRKEVYMQTAFQPGGVETLRKGYNQQSGQFSEQKAINDAITVGIQVQGAVIQKNNLAAQDFAKTLEYQMNIRRISVKNEQDSLDIIIKQKKNQEEILSTLSGIGGFAGAEVQRQTGILKLQQQELTAQQQRLNLGLEIEKQEKGLELLESGKSLLKGQQLTDAIKETKISLQTAVLKQNEFDIITASQLAQTKLRSEIENVAIIQAENNRLKQEEYQILIDTQSKTSELLSAEQSLLQAKKEALYYSDLAYISIKNSAEVRAVELKTTQALTQAEQKRAADLAAIQVDANKARAIINTTSEDQDQYVLSPAQQGAVAVLSEIDQKTKVVNDNYEKTKKHASDIKAIELERLEIAKEAEIRAQNWKDLMEDIAKTTASLGIVFGEIGVKIGAAAEIFAKMAQEREANLSKEIGMRKELEKVTIEEQDDDPVGLLTKKRIDLQDALSKQTQKSQRDTVRGYAAEAGAIKSLFKEKTAAHKMFAALEMSLHVTSMAMLVAENAATLAALPAKIANGVASFFKENPWAGFAGAAAFLALMASLGSNTGGSSSAPSMTKEQRQETQGTGQTYVDGKLEETGRGVFGDAEARSKSIDNSLAIIRDTAVEGQDIFNSMEEYLFNIQNSMEEAVEALYQIQGLRMGSLFGTQEGTDVSNKLGGLLSSKSTSTEITDSGIKLSGTILQLAEDTGKFVKVWEEVATTTSKSYLGGLIKGGTSTSTSIQEDTLENKASADTVRVISDIFNQAEGIFIDLGESLGIARMDIRTELAKIPVDAFASLKGLTGDAFTEAFNAVINSVLDDVTQNLFEGLSQFRQFGEGFLETAIRVTNNNKIVTQALENLGIDITEGLYETSNLVTKSKTSNIVEKVQVGTTASIYDQNSNLIDAGGIPILEEKIKTITETVTELVVNSVEMQSIAISEALIKMAGGTEEFVSKANFYFENFLTKEEQLAIRTNKVTTELARLENSDQNKYSNIDFSSIDTAQEFADTMKILANPLSLATENGQYLYTAMMTLGESFVDVYGGIEGTSNKVNQLTAELYKLQGRTDEAIAIERNAILEELKTDEEKNIQNQIFAYQDAAKIRKLDIELLQAQGLGYEALIASREEELITLTKAERDIKLQIYAAQDLAKTQDLTIRLMRAQGKSQEALTLERTKELKALSDTDAAIMLQIYALEDLAKTQDLTIRLMRAQGKSQEALTLERTKEVRALSDTDAAIMLQIYALEDLAKTQDLTVRLMKLQGQNTEALNIERTKELSTLSDTDAAIMLQIYALEDLAKMYTLNTELLTAQGEGYKALIARRKEEIKTLTKEQQLKKLEIYAAEDASVTQDLVIRLLKAQGKATEALNLEREKELKNYSLVDQKLLELIWSYEDAAAATDSLTTSLESITSTLTDQIKKLKEYKQSLLLGDLSPLTTADKYVETKSTIQELLDTISKVPTNDKEREAQADAVDKLIENSDSYLELSRKLFASSVPYDKDFAWINSVIDTATGSLEDQLSDAEKQLAELKKSNETLTTIADHTATIAAATTAYQAALANAKPTTYIEETTPIQEPVNTSADVISQAISIFETLATTSLDVIMGSYYTSMAEYWKTLLPSSENIVPESTAAEESSMDNSFWKRVLTAVSTAVIGSETETSSITSNVLAPVDDSLTASQLQQEEITQAIEASSVSQLKNELGQINLFTQNIISSIDNNTKELTEQIKELNNKVTLLQDAIVNGSIAVVTSSKENTAAITTAVTGAASSQTYMATIQQQVSIA